MTDLAIKPQQRPHWYRIYIDECVLCGRTTEERERVYGEKPLDGCVKFSQSACSEHFL